MPWVGAVWAGSVVPFTETDPVEEPEPVEDPLDAGVEGSGVLGATGVLAGVLGAADPTEVDGAEVAGAVAALDGAVGAVCRAGRWVVVRCAGRVVGECFALGRVAARGGVVAGATGAAALPACGFVVGEVFVLPDPLLARMGARAMTIAASAMTQSATRARVGGPRRTPWCG